MLGGSLAARGHLTRRDLAALAERGDDAEVEQLWTDVIAESSGDRGTTRSDANGSAA
jgi:hypothetical protein